MAVNDLKYNGPPIPSVPWAHWIGRDGNDGMDGNWGFADGNQQVLTFQVYWTDIYAAIQDLMGVNCIQKSPGVANVLHRKLPAKHPNFEWLYCSRITGTKGYHWLGKADTQSQSTASFYQFALITAVFTMPKYRTLEDADVPWVNGQRQEQDRFLEFVPQVSVETLSREAGSFTWAEGPTPGAPFNSPVAQALVRGDAIATWRRVPLYNALYSSSAATLNTPTNLDSALGSINKTSILGRPAQTLRFNGYRITPEECPTDPADMNLPKGYSPLVASVELVWSYWNPPHNPASTSGLGGHNLCPFPKDNNSYWYYVTADGTLAAADTSGIYQVKEYSIVFQLPG